jgi:membrane-bound lytic murein transglycosylase MltF
MKKSSTKNKPNKTPNPTPKVTNIDQWLEIETPHKQTALENASRHFSETDALTVNTLEAIYAQESSFGKNRRNRGIKGAAGDFQLEKETAERMGLTVTAKNDERFDVDNASAASAKYLKTQDRTFSKSTVLSKDISTIPVEDAVERKNFAIAAFNAGEGRIAQAQKLAKEDGKNPAKWDDVKKYLKPAGATDSKVKETQEYVDRVLENEAEFAKKSEADKSVKLGRPRKIKKLPTGGHWITLDGIHIFIEGK